MTEIQNSKPDSVALNVLKFCNHDRRAHHRMARYGLIGFGHWIL